MHGVRLDTNDRAAWDRVAAESGTAFRNVARQTLAGRSGEAESLVDDVVQKGERTELFVHEAFRKSGDFFDQRLLDTGMMSEQVHDIRTSDCSGVGAGNDVPSRVETNLRLRDGPVLDRGVFFRQECRLHILRIFSQLLPVAIDRLFGVVVQASDDLKHLDARSEG